MAKSILTKKETEIMQIMQLNSLEEVLEHYPFRYEVISHTPYENWLIGEKVTFEGKIVTAVKTTRFGARSASRFDVMLENDAIVHCTIFNRNWISKIPLGTICTFFGKFEGKDRVTLSNYNTKRLSEQEGIVPVYNMKEGVTMRYFTNLVKKAFEYAHIEERVPLKLRQKYRLLDHRYALEMIHFPASSNALKMAQRTLKYEEFLIFETKIALNRQDHFVSDEHYAKKFNPDDVYMMANCLPYTLTSDQLKTVNEIICDLESPKPMIRLVQGDVGCGKTVVAALALYANALANKQGAFMVPTEILAVQQYQELKNILKASECRIACLYGALKASEKQEILDGLKNGEIDIVVGTHSLIQNSVSFKDLGLVITDEQHRFGVNQRSKLKEKGEFVDQLVMSATPIPRTLAGVLYGDMDVSSIMSQPPGRKPIQTTLIQRNSIIDIYDNLVEHLKADDRIYIICASIENDEETNIRDVTSIHEALSKKFAHQFSVGLLHGRMKPEEKDEVMRQFKSGETRILVSTTVVEVGVNVKEANIMIVYNADRFGLSQLHQLRGRVKRGSKQGYCYLLTDSKEADSLERLQALCDNENGFAIAEIDLKMRGMGDLLGSRQSGLPTFKIGNLLTDTAIIRCALEDALMIVGENDPGNEVLLNYCRAQLENAEGMN